MDQDPCLELPAHRRSKPWITDGESGVEAAKTGESDAQEKRER